MTEVLFSEDVVTEITSSVWRAFLAESDDIIPAALVPSDSSLTGTVSISGQWNGLVSLTCSSIAATRAAALMFDAEIEDVSPADVLDAVGELVNIVGGNLKGMLPSPTGLSLPEVTDGTVHIDTRAGADLLVDVQLSWMDEPVQVAIWGKDGLLPSV
jgi:chemotaxis protein CheX